MSPYDYLVIRGKKTAAHGQLTMRLYSENGTVLTELDTNYSELDQEWHRYVIDIRKAEGPCTLILSGGYIDNTGSSRSEYIIGDVTLY